MVRFSFSPNGSNRQPTRRDRIEQAKRELDETEKSLRRRNFGFLKNAESKRMSSTTLNRNREHAKQLALAFNEDPLAATPTSVNSGQGLLAFGGRTEETFDPFRNNSNNAFSPSNAFSTKRTVTNGSATILDQHFVSSSRRQEREPTTSTQDSFETASVGSAYNTGVFQSQSASTSMFQTPSSSANRKTNKKGRQPSLDQFVEKTRAPTQGSGSYSGASFDRSKAERSVISMPTFPSNSSMQSSFAKQTTTPTSTSSSVAGAAARRRFRNQMRQSSGDSVSVSSSLGGGDDSSYHSMTNTATPPESPASSRGQQGTSAGRNRVQAYQRTPQGSSFHSQASSSANNSNQGSDSSNLNLFDSHNMDGGFTFDAFGLDQLQVEREVNEAMKALAGQGMREFSAFFNNDTDGEFPMQTWDSPANSRRSSPAPSDSETDGFVDGFRVTTKVTPSRSTYSHNSASSSPVSSSGERSFSSPASRRLIRAQGRETIVLPAARTPPRWEDARRNGGDIFGSPVSNPWKEDPWGSGDDDREFSDSGASDFAGTQS